jgi:hypothetical protein
MLFCTNIEPFCFHYGLFSLPAAGEIVDAIMADDLIDFDFDFYFSDDELNLPNSWEDGGGGDGDGEGEGDGDDGVYAAGSRSGSGKAQRPTTVREHSKAQREKRKNMLVNLERQAEIIAKQKEESEARCQRTFAAVESSRKIYFRQLSSFLQLWFGKTSLEPTPGNVVAAAASSSTSSSSSSSSSSATAIAETAAIGVAWGGEGDGVQTVEGDVPWSAVVDADRLVVTMPLISTFWVPPVTPLTPPQPHPQQSHPQPQPQSQQSNTHASTKPPNRLRLRSAQHVTGYKEGFNLLCASIARYGTNIVDRLLFSTALRTDSFIVDRTSVAARFVLSTKNAILCGGNDEMTIGGYVYGRFAPSHKLESVDIYLNGIDLRKLVSCLAAYTVR